MADLKPIYKRVNGEWVKQTAYLRQNGKWIKISSDKETLPAGLYDANNTLLASWDTLVNGYGMDCTAKYDLFDFPPISSDGNAPYYVLKKYSDGTILIISNDINAIGNFAFYDCKKLTSITIPNSVTSIGNNAFDACYGLKRVDFSTHTEIPSLANKNAFADTYISLQIKVPASLIDSWKSATNWSALADKIVTEFTNEV